MIHFSTRFLFIALLLIGGLFVGCASEKKAVKKEETSQIYKDYYFDLDDFITPKYYVLTCSEDSTKTQYWKITSNAEDQVLITQSFDYQFQCFEVFVERYDNEGSKLVSYDIILPDVEFPTLPLRKDVFNWSSKKEYKYAVKCSDNYATYLFTKRRIVHGTEVINAMGKQCTALKIRGNYMYQDLGNEPRREDYGFWQYSYYVNGMGFVEYQRYFPDGSEVNLKLTKILSEAEWNQLKAEN